MWAGRGEDRAARKERRAAGKDRGPQEGEAKVQNLQVVFLSSADSLKEESGTIFGSQIKVFQTFLYYSCLMIRFSHTVLLNEF